MFLIESTHAALFRAVQFITAAIIDADCEDSRDALDASGGALRFLGYLRR